MDTYVVSLPQDSFTGPSPSAQASRLSGIAYILSLESIDRLRMNLDNQARGMDPVGMEGYICIRSLRPNPSECPAVNDNLVQEHLRRTRLCCLVRVLDPGLRPR